MKAIETRWKGYRFRSRTEARWAVFFDAAGIDFEYEPEGYVLPSGPYLPDFRLRTYTDMRSGAERAAGATPRIVEQTTFLEVKGVLPSDDECRRCGELLDHVRDAGERLAEMLIAVGAPDLARRVYPVCAVWNAAGERTGDYQIFVDEPGHFATAGPDGPMGLSVREITPAAEDWVICPMGHRTRQEAAKPSAFSYPVIPPWMQAAYDAARSARFEFGETDQRWQP